MKFLLQIEIDAHEHTGNPDYPREVNAIQWLQDQLQLAQCSRIRSISKLIAENKLKEDDPIIIHMENINKEIDRAIYTIKPLLVATNLQR